MQLNVKIKDFRQDITHTVTGIGDSTHECNVNAIKSLRKLLGHDQLEIVGNPQIKPDALFEKILKEPSGGNQ